MRNVFTAGLAAGLAALAAAPAVQAAPVTVDLRVEGAKDTLHEAPVRTDVRPVDGGDGTGAHRCDAGARVPTAGTALADAAQDTDLTWKGEWSDEFGDFLVKELLGEVPTGRAFWGFYVNGRFATAGVCSTEVDQGDKVLFAIARGSERVLALSGPGEVRLGRPVELVVTDAATGEKVSGAAVAGRISGANGTVRLTLNRRGVRSFKATLSGAIRSNAHAVCVTDGRGDGFCGTRDRRGPSVSLLDIASDAVFARRDAPRELGGRAADPSGVRRVRLRIARRSGGACESFDRRQERFRAVPCGEALAFTVSRRSEWSYVLPKRLGRGRYVVEVTATDKAGNRAIKRVSFAVR